MMKGFLSCTQDDGDPPAKNVRSPSQTNDLSDGGGGGGERKESFLISPARSSLLSFDDGELPFPTRN